MKSKWIQIPVAIVMLACLLGATTHFGDQIISGGDLRISSLGDAKIPYHVDDASGLADSPLEVSGTDVGIGVTPTRKLEVAGDMRLSGANRYIYGSNGIFVAPGTGQCAIYDGSTNMRLDIYSGGTLKIKWDSNGNCYVNGLKTAFGHTSPTAAVDLGGSVAAAASLRIRSGVAPSSPNDGDIWNDSTRNAPAFYSSSTKQYQSGSLYASTADKTVANTTSETTLIPNTITLPANFFVAGKTIKLRLWGTLQDTGTPSLDLKVKLGSSQMVLIAFTPDAGSSDGWHSEVTITCRTTGSSGAFRSVNVLHNQDSGGTTPRLARATQTVNTTTSQQLDVTAKWDTANVLNTITCEGVVVERVH